MPLNHGRPTLEARPQDYLLAAAMVFASALFLVPDGSAGHSGAARAKLSRAGKVLAELPLDKPGSRTFEAGGARFTVEVRPGRGIHISESNCPAKVCVHSGWAVRPGETVACLPNRVLLEIEGEKAEYDAVIH